MDTSSKRALIASKGYRTETTEGYLEDWNVNVGIRPSRKLAEWEQG